MANTTVQSEQIEDGSITAAKLADGTIVAAELADNAVVTAAINADAVTGAKIADNAIDSEHYTDGSIDTAHIADAQITVGKMAANSVDSDQYVDGSIDTVHIADAQVTTAKITDGNISTGKIADNAVTSAKIDTNIDIAGTFDVTGATTLDSTLAVAGDANFDSGTLFVDVSANRVGIGTTSPAAPLDVVSNSSAVGIELRGRSADNIGQLTFESNDSGTTYSQLQSLSTELKVKTVANIPMSFHTNNTERMRIDLNGKVGIGTAAPADYWSTASNLVVKESSGNGGISIVTGTSNTGQLYFADGTSGDARYRGWLNYNHTDDKMALATAASTKVMILSDGKVGIGTEVPDVKLHVFGGDSGATSFDAGDLITIENNDSVSFNIATPNSNTANILFSDAAARGQGRIVYDHGSDYMAFMTNGISSEKMRIHSGGTLSIGTTVSNVSNFGGNPPKLFVTASGVNNRCANFYYGSTDNYEAVEFSHDRATGSNTAIIMGFRNAAGSSIGTIACTASATAYNTSSDARKKNVISEASGLDTIQKLNPVKFEWKDSGLIESGLIAQEVLEVEDTAYTVKENTDGYYVMDYSKLVTPLVKAIQEQQTIIEDLKARIETLEG